MTALTGDDAGIYQYDLDISVHKKWYAYIGATKPNPKDWYAFFDFTEDALTEVKKIPRLATEVDGGDTVKWINDFNETLQIRMEE